MDLVLSIDLSIINRLTCHVNRKGLFAMSEKQRVRLIAHSTNISNVVLTQYQHVSDGAKLTYFVLESYDWPDETGKSKGKCWPSIETLAQARGKSYDTIVRHLKELEKAGLIRIESGQDTGTTNRYWLLNPSEEETQLYITRITGKPSEKIVTPENLQPEQKQVTPYLKNEIPSAAKMRHHEESNMKESKKHDDSNQQPPKTQTFKNSKLGACQTTPYLAKLMDDFSRLLNDTEHAASNRTQIINLYRESGMPERTFTQLLYEAKKRAQWATVTSVNPLKGGPNRAAYFFKVVRDLLADDKAKLTYLPNIN